MSRLKRLIVEIHRRSLWQVLLIYAGGAWIAYEIVQSLTEGLGLPAWFPGFAVVLFIIGLPFVLATAFVREAPAPRAGPVQPVPATAEPRPDDRRVGAESMAKHHLLNLRVAALVFLSVAAIWGVIATGWYLMVREEGDAIAPANRKSIAVLPFKNLSGTSENEPFTYGIHDDVLTHLSRISDLKVTSRTSVMEYLDTRRNIREIAEELGVSAILEGGVQRAGHRVRINVQLIDAATDEHLWAGQFDTVLNVETIFSIQSHIAERIAAELQAELSPGERERIEARPTEVLEAYDYYIRGNNNFNRGYAEDALRVAAEMYERALALDPEFALAHARLSRTYSALHFFHYAVSGEYLGPAREAADRALELAPDLAEAHLAAGYYYYWGLEEYDQALTEFAFAREHQPNNSDLIQAIAAVQRRQGEWESALSNFGEALALDPRSAIKTLEVGFTHALTRDYATALPYFERAISLAPDWATTYVWKAVMHLSWNGDIESARRALQAAAGKVPHSELLSDFSAAFFTRALFRTLHDDYADVIREQTVADFGADTPAYYLTKADLFTQDADLQRARAYSDSARRVLEPRVRNAAELDVLHSQLALAYAGLGMKEEAIREARLAAELLPVSRDAFYGTDPATDLARVYATFGEHDAALNQIETLLAIPGWLSTHWLTLDPVWQPLHDHPRFSRLFEE
jgi:TolB-like protein/Flp pilus assembly protein TadD